MVGSVNVQALPARWCAVLVVRQASRRELSPAGSRNPAHSAACGLQRWEKGVVVGWTKVRGKVDKTLRSSGSATGFDREQRQAGHWQDHFVREIAVSPAVHVITRETKTWEKPNDHGMAVSGNGGGGEREPRGKKEWAATGNWGENSSDQIKSLELSDPRTAGSLAPEIPR